MTWYSWYLSSKPQNNKRVASDLHNINWSSLEIQETTRSSSAFTPLFVLSMMSFKSSSLMIQRDTKCSVTGRWSVRFPPTGTRARRWRSSSGWSHDGPVCRRRTATWHHSPLQWPLCLGRETPSQRPDTFFYCGWGRARERERETLKELSVQLNYNSLCLKNNLVNV